MAIFSGLDNERYDRQYTDSELVARIVSYFKPYKKELLITCVMISVVALAGAGQPLLVARSVQALAESITTSLIVTLTLGLVVAGVGIWAANWYRRRLTVRIIGEVVSTLRQDGFIAAINHDMAFFDEYESGRVISRITTDTQEFAQVVQLVTEIVSQVLLFLILSVILFSISWQLTLLLLVLVPFVLGFTMLFRRLARYVTRRGFQVIARVNASIQEAVTGIGIAKNLCSGPFTGVHAFCAS